MTTRQRRAAERAGLTDELITRLDSVLLELSKSVTILVTLDRQDESVEIMEIRAKIAEYVNHFEETL